MTGVLTTGQTSPRVLPEQPLVPLNNSVEKSTRGQLSQLVPTPQVTPPEFIQPNRTILCSPSPPTIERDSGVHASVEDTASTLASQLCQVELKRIPVSLSLRVGPHPTKLGCQTTSSPPQELCGVSSKHFSHKALTTKYINPSKFDWQTTRNTIHKIFSKLNSHNLYQVCPESLPSLAGVRGSTVRSETHTSSLALLSLSKAWVNTAIKNSRPQQTPATQISDKPLTIDKQDSDNNIVVKKYQNLNNLSLPILHYGDSGISVKILQRLLLFNGYAVELDGLFGALTETAVKAFQYRRNLVTDGIVGEKTWDELTK
ncbi:MAG: peptidoglycan-binding protein [Stigonema ocellatum SAG 48.90 = DSM 106950]|nr:peptidoglycan-binding protein [Stigonema ocellatum SAG 48.90 = DSM 106950]